MNKYAFILTSVAGLSTMLGFLFIFIKDKNIISKSLGFASGVMITISIIDLIPNSLFLIIKKYNLFISLFLIIIAFILGIIISNITRKKDVKVGEKNSKLYKLGIITMLVIIIHNIPEGIATYITTTKNVSLGIILTIAIALHNIPEGISISIPIYYSTKSKFKAFLYTFISGISEPVGAVIAYLLLARYMTDTISGMLYSFIGGMMINISINELYKESITYNKKYTLIYFIIGSVVMITSHLLLS